MEELRFGEPAMSPQHTESEDVRHTQSLRMSELGTKSEKDFLLERWDGGTREGGVNIKGGC